MTRLEAIAASLCARCKRVPHVAGRRSCAACLTQEAKRAAQRLIKRHDEGRIDGRTLRYRADVEQWSYGSLHVTRWANASQMPCFVEQRTRMAA